MSAISLHNVTKTYVTGELQVPVLRDITLELAAGETVAIMGPSGSGKSTLMNIIGLLDRPTSGELKISDKQVSLSMSDGALAALRSEKIGFVFQSFNLLARQSALANVLLPTAYRKAGQSDRVVRAKKLLTDLGLGHRIDHKPTEMSGGERQRVAIARALINDPDIILADEPTGNLDSKSGKEVMDILMKLAAQGKTVLVITHDPNVAEYCGRMVRLFDGHLKEGGHHA
jgi:putative ABC transport system ATP-binding protein